MKWLWLVLLAGCGDNGSPQPRVHDGFLHDAEGRAMIMRGVNLSGAQKIWPYLDDKTPPDYARAHDDWGFNAIRFIMTWSAVEPTQGVYDEQYLTAVRERMGWAHHAGLDVVVEMHEDIYGEGFGFDGAPAWTCDSANYAGFVPSTPWFVSATDPKVMACVDHLMNDEAIQTQFAAMWAHVALTLSDQPAVIGFDLLNEPNWGTAPLLSFERDTLAPFYDRVVPAVLEVAPNWIAFLEPGASR
ncbi:MAG TPA: cellulase family glycosylhydrolase, partial [Kofleriaceae bacterium]